MCSFHRLAGMLPASPSVHLADDGELNQIALSCGGTLTVCSRLVRYPTCANYCL